MDPGRLEDESRVRLGLASDKSRLPLKTDEEPTMTLKNSKILQAIQENAGRNSDKYVQIQAENNEAAIIQAISETKLPENEDNSPEISDINFGQKQPRKSDGQNSLSGLHEHKSSIAIAKLLEKARLGTEKDIEKLHHSENRTFQDDISVKKSGEIISSRLQSELSSLFPGDSSLNSSGNSSLPTSSNSESSSTFDPRESRQKRDPFPDFPREPNGEEYLVSSTNNKTEPEYLSQDNFSRLNKTSQRNLDSLDISDPLELDSNPPNLSSTTPDTKTSKSQIPSIPADLKADGLSSQSKQNIEATSRTSAASQTTVASRAPAASQTTVASRAPAASQTTVASRAPAASLGPAASQTTVGSRDPADQGIKFIIADDPSLVTLTDATRVTTISSTTSGDLTSTSSGDLTSTSSGDLTSTSSGDLTSTISSVDLTPTISAPEKDSSETESVFEVYDYMGLVDYGDDDEDYQEEGGKLAEAAELLADEEYYDYYYEEGRIRIPFNYSGLQFTGFEDGVYPRPWNAKTAFIEQVGKKLYMFVPAIAGGVLLGIILWMATIFIIRSYGVLKRRVLGHKGQGGNRQTTALPLRELSDFNAHRIHVAGDSPHHPAPHPKRQSSFYPTTPHTAPSNQHTNQANVNQAYEDTEGLADMHHETSQSMDMAASPAMATSPTLTMDMSPSPASMDMTEVDVHESGDKMSIRSEESNASKSSGIGVSEKSSLNSSRSKNEDPVRKAESAGQTLLRKSSISYKDIIRQEVKGTEKRRKSD